MAYFRKEDLTEVPITTVVTTVADDPLVLYNTWATELGLSTTATAYGLDANDSTWFITIPGYFLKGSQTTLTEEATFTSEGILGLYLNPITDTYLTRASEIDGIVDGLSIALPYLPTDRPDLLYAFHPTGLDCRATGVKLQRTANTTIISGTLQNWNNASIYIKFALRLERNKITMVCSAATVAVNHQLIGYTRGTTSVYTHSIELAQSIGTVQKIVFTIPGIQYSLSGNTNESSDIDTWNVVLSRCSTGETLNTTTITGATYNMVQDFHEACNITLAPKIDYQWAASKVAVVGDFVVPSNPDTTPHLFKVTTEGTFGITEASWNLTGTTPQGTATLTYIAPLIDPVTIGPKLGTYNII